MAIQLYYSTGSITSSVFEKNPSKSIGGLISNTQVLGGLHNLFGFVSLRDIQYTAIEYRCIYIKNSSLTNELQNLKLYIEKPYIVTTQTNPALLTPSVNDTYLIPASSVGVWYLKDGFLATWNGTMWIYSQPYLYTFEFGLDADVSPQILNSVFDTPFGVEFSAATSDDDGTTNSFTIGNINQNETKILWIKRIVGTYTITKYDFLLNSELYNELLKINQAYNLIISGDSMDGIEILNLNEDTYNANEVIELMFTVKTMVAGESQYENLQFEFSCKYNGETDLTQLTCDAIFDGETFEDIQTTLTFADFVSTTSMTETLQLDTTFLDVGIFDITLSILDMNNDNNIIYTNEYRFTIN